MDVAKVAKDYFVSSQSSLLIPNREYGSRKLIHIGIARSQSTGSFKTPVSELPLDVVQEDLQDHRRRQPGLVGSLKGLPGQVFSSANRHLGLRQTKGNSFSSGSSPGVVISKEHETTFDFQPRSSKQWLHPPEALSKGHILYTVKFLGECIVDEPKGTLVVKNAIRKMKFNKHIKRAEGQKPPKVELTISVDAVQILEPKSRVILYKYPLHRISYCADDKSDKRMFTFIGKAATTNDHYCYVFDSEKCAEEITLTIGQAFDQAYKKFMETSSSDVDFKKQYLVLQKKVNTLQFENDQLRKRVSELQQLKDRSDLEEYMKNKQIQDLSVISLNLSESSTDEEVFPTYSEPHRQSSVVGRRLENLLVQDDISNGAKHTNGFQSPSTYSAAAPVLSPPPVNTRSHRASSLTHNSQQPIQFNSTNPFASPTPAPNNDGVDSFGMPVFGSNSANESDMNEIQAGFSRGLSFGTDDFSLDDLDPLNQK